MILKCPKCGSGVFRNSFHVVWGAACCKCGTKWQVIPTGSDPEAEASIEPYRKDTEETEKDKPPS